MRLCAIFIARLLCKGLEERKRVQKRRTTVIPLHLHNHLLDPKSAMQAKTPAIPPTRLLFSSFSYISKLSFLRVLRYAPTVTCTSFILSDPIFAICTSNREHEPCYVPLRTTGCA